MRLAPSNKRVRPAALVLIAGLLASCGGQRTPQVAGTVELNRKIEGLKQGTSIEATKALIGDPVTEVYKGNEATLYYPRWQLEFTSGNLKVKVKLLSDALGDRAVARPARLATTRAILGLHRGMSIEKVTSRLGPPDEYEVEITGRSRRRVLWYGAWELSFYGRRLTQRTRW